jgi:hypothetical protein
MLFLHQRRHGASFFLLCSPAPASLPAACLHPLHASVIAPSPKTNTEPHKKLNHRLLTHRPGLDGMCRMAPDTHALFLLVFLSVPEAPLVSQDPLCFPGLIVASFSRPFRLPRPFHPPSLAQTESTPFTRLPSTIATAPNPIRTKPALHVGANRLPQFALPVQHCNQDHSSAAGWPAACPCLSINRPSAAPSRNFSELF